MKRAAAALVFLLVSETSTADDWMTGTGGRPDRNGLSSEHAPTAPAILWDTCPHTSVFGEQAVIAGGMVVSSRISSYTDIIHNTWVVAQDLETGAELWSIQLPINFPDSWWSRVVAIRDGQVYATRAGNTNLEYLYALDPDDGSVAWPSQALTDMYGNETPSFAENGDLIVGNYTSVLRIDHTDGHTVWQTPRQSVGSGGGEIAVYGNRAYGWDLVDSPNGLEQRIAVYDVTSGQKLYASAPLRYQFFGINDAAPFVGTNGTVYVALQDGTPTDALVALVDVGTSITEIWRIFSGHVPFASFAVGPDGSVYGYSTDSEVLRIDTLTGNVLNTSIPIPHGGIFTPKISADARGRIYLTNNLNTLFSFDSDLRLRWTDFVPDVTYGGPSIGQDGTIVVTGSGTTVRAYRTPFSGDAPLRVDARTGASTVSDGNGVLEPGETVFVEPSWENGTNTDAALAGTASSLQGPGSGAYTIEDAGSDYGLVAAGSSANCFDATALCPRMTVGDPGLRPAAHWDATFDETLSAGADRTWALHVGDSFPDVPRSDPFYPYVETILHNGVTAGCAAGYCRDAGVTRAQMSVFLLKARHGLSFAPPPATGTVFEDVSAGSFAADWIEELAAEGITGGCSASPSLYCPNAVVTRAQMAVFLLKAEHGKRFVPPPCAGVFSDVSCPGGFAVEWIEALAAEGVTAGCGGGAYCPDNPNTRGQMAPFLVKTFGLRLYGP